MLSLEDVSKNNTDPPFTPVRGTRWPTVGGGCQGRCWESPTFRVRHGRCFVLSKMLLAGRLALLAACLEEMEGSDAAKEMSLRAVLKDAARRSRG